MRIESAITRTISIVDRTLRKEFPDDYDKRCMYAAFATCALLRDVGFDANLVGGDFMAFVVAASGERAGLQGFGYGEDQPSHFWVELLDTVVDLGPHYLPRSSRFPAVPMPVIAWQPATALPPFLRYRAQVHYDPEVQLQSDAGIIARKDRFVSQCKNKYSNQVGQPKAPSWILNGPASLATAARESDAWALSAIRFAQGIDESQLPF